MKHILVSAIAAIAIAAFAGPAFAGSIIVEKAWASEYAKGGEDRGDVFLVIKNTGNSADTLYAAKTVFAKQAKLEAQAEAKVDQGESETVLRVEIPAGETVRMTDDGPHIELHGVRQEFEPGKTFKMTLYFEHAGPVFTTVTIEESDE